MSSSTNKGTTITDTSIVTLGANKIATNPLAEYNYWLTQQAPATIQSSITAFNKTSTISQDPNRTGYITDVQVSAYMRAIDIDFVCYNMRPNRKVHMFFDGKDVSKLVQKPNIIKIDNNRDFIGILPRPVNVASNVNSNGTITGPVDTTQETIRIGGGTARIFYTKKDTDGNTILYISEIKQPNKDLDWANGKITITSTRTGAIANVISADVSNGYLTRLLKATQYANNTVPTALTNSRYYNLDITSNMSQANLVGKTITLVGGPNPGQTAEILTHNVANGEVYLSKDFTNFTTLANVVYSIDNVDPTTSVGNLYTDNKGIFAGTLRIPNPNFDPNFRFTVGDKLIRIIDSVDNDPEDATTIAEFNFVAFGLSLSTSQLVINGPVKQPVATLPTAVVIPGSPAPVIQPDPIQTPIQVESYQPLAQSFYVSPKEYPKGFFTPYIDLFFANKGTLPIEIQIRPLVNGFPDVSRILPNAIAYLDADDVKVTQNPDPNDSNSYTRFTFPSPVYLAPDQDYAIVVKTNDFDYDIYISELGQKIIGTNRIVSQQPYTGLLFKSQNSSTYSEIQDEDMMFVIHKCIFETNGGTVFFKEHKDPTHVVSLMNPTLGANAYVDAFEVHSDSIEFPGATINYSYRATSNSNKTLDSSYTNFRADKRVSVDQRKIIYDPNVPEESFIMRLDMVTNSPDISPIVYKNKQSVSAIQAVINNMGIDGNRIIVQSPGFGYTTQNTSVTFTSNTGQGANAVVIIEAEPLQIGKILTLAFDSNGYGYYDDVNVNVTSRTAAGAVIKVASETGKAFGPAAARYISKTVTLAPEFDAGDLRVYLTAIRPKEADIEVYYKVRNNFDNQDIRDKNWVRMVKVPGINEYSNGQEPIEIEYRPSLSSNTIVYSTETATFNSFNQFKIKIVMASTDTVLDKIPYVYDMRAIALPGDV